MKMALRVQYEDGRVQDANATVKDFVAFEEKFDRSIVDFSRDVRLTWVTWLAWHALKRRDAQVPDYEAWSDTVDTVEVDVAGKELPPLETSQPTG